jgi:hypothetical protein
MTLTVQAQEDATKFGIKGGVNFSNFYTDDVDDNNVLTGFNVGLLLKCLFPENISSKLRFRTQEKELN